MLLIINLSNYALKLMLLFQNWLETMHNQISIFMNFEKQTETGLIKTSKIKDMTWFFQVEHQNEETWGDILEFVFEIYSSHAPLGKIMENFKILGSKLLNIMFLHFSGSIYCDKNRLYSQGETLNKFIVIIA